MAFPQRAKESCFGCRYHPPFPSFFFPLLVQRQLIVVEGLVLVIALTRDAEEAAAAAANARRLECKRTEGLLLFSLVWPYLQGREEWGIVEKKKCLGLGRKREEVKKHR